MRLDYLAERLLLFFVVVWVSATINFVLPRLSGGNAIRTRCIRQAAQGGYVQSNIDAMVAEYDKDFGLDRPLYEQYLIYLWNISHLDFGFSMASYPMRVSTLMADALPVDARPARPVHGDRVQSWAISLGALLAWPKTPRILVNVLLPPFLTLSAVPYYMLGLVLLWVFAFQYHMSADLRCVHPRHHPRLVGLRVHQGRGAGTWCCRRCRSCSPRSASGRWVCAR